MCILQYEGSICVNEARWIRFYIQAVSLSACYPGQKNRFSRDIHEIDPQCDHVISRDIDFDLQRELAPRSYRESRHCRTEARYRTISHDRTVDQPHEFLGCNDFFGQGSSTRSTCNVWSSLKFKCQKHRLLHVTVGACGNSNPAFLFRPETGCILTSTLHASVRICPVRPASSDRERHATVIPNCRYGRHKKSWKIRWGLLDLKSRLSSHCWVRRNSRKSTSFHFGPDKGGFPGQRRQRKLHRCIQTSMYSARRDSRLFF